jgi:ArsR family transcriptional regulator, arsenate/arsenite/antimonite-responsive transcriptional repressor
VVTKRVAQFSALGQRDRLQIFRMLVRAGPQGNCADEIKRRFGMPGSTLSHHLDALTRSGLLTAQRAGRFIYYAINWREAASLIRFLTEDCCADLHTRVTESVISKQADTRNNEQGACCTNEKPATVGSIGPVGIKRPKPAANAMRTFDQIAGRKLAPGKRRAPD